MLNQQDWRRASDRGRAIHVHSKYSSSSSCSSRLYRYFSNYIMYIISGTAVYNGTSGCWRAKVGERQRASDMYVNSNTSSSTCSSTYFEVIFLRCIKHTSAVAPVRNFTFYLRFVRSFSGGERATAGKRRDTYEQENNTGKVRYKENSRRYTRTRHTYFKI